VNRAQRRQAARQPLLVAIERADAAQRQAEADLEAQAIAIAESIPAPGETVAESLAALTRGIADLEANPMSSVVAGPALAVLRRRRDELAAL